MNCLRLTIPAFVLSSLSCLGMSVNSFGNCLSKTDTVYELTNIPISTLNPFLQDNTAYLDLVLKGCPQSRDAGSICYDKPAIGSGLAQLQPNYFLGLTDRGPNQDCEELYGNDPVEYKTAMGKTGKGFPLPLFAPSIVHFSTDSDSNQLTLYRSTPLKGRDGNPITGISNTPMDDTPFGPNCAGAQLPYDPSGLDAEDLAHIPNTDYVAIVDEYSPSLVIANYNTGIILTRHAPQLLQSMLSAARYNVVADIPNIYSERRSNRGFEGVVVDADAKYVIAILQSPMLGSDETSTEKNTIIRCAYFNMSIMADGIPNLSYTKSFIIEASSPSAYEDPTNVPKDMKYSAAQYRSKGKFIALERAVGQVKLFLIDWSQATNIDDTKYANNLDLEKETNGEYLASQKGVRAATKRLVWDSARGVGGTVDFEGSDKMEGFAIDMKDDSKLWMINDNDFGLENLGNTELFKFSLGRAPDGATVCAMPSHPPAPQMNMQPTKEISLVNPSTYRVDNVPDASGAENLDVNEVLKRVYVANVEMGAIDIYNASTSPVTLLDSYKAVGSYEPTSVSVCPFTNRVAVGLTSTVDHRAPGAVDIIGLSGKFHRRITRKACVLVDNVKWSKDCKFLVGACEGEGGDVPGGILVADFNGPLGKSYRGTQVASFKPFDRIVRFFDENGVRLIESRTPSLDLEPEYVTIEGYHAFVTVQENNAIAVVDVYEASVTELKPIGFIDRRQGGFAIDASDKDGDIRIQNYPFLYGMPQPDSISSFVANDNQTYLVFSNEGDAKEVEEYRGADLINVNELNSTVVAGLNNLVKDVTLLGRLRFSSIMGYNNVTNTQENMFHFGGRSFAIMSLDGSIVFDSGEWLARIQEMYFPNTFTANGFDDEGLVKVNGGSL